MITDIALLDKTDITVRAPGVGEVTLVISRTDAGYTCALWSQDKCLGNGKFGPKASAIAKMAVIGPLLVQGKNYLAATAQKYPNGLEVDVRVEHGGQVHKSVGKIPLDGSKLAQLMALLDWARKTNEKFQT